MIVCYDLGKRLPTYDFFCWLGHVKFLGATEVTISEGRKFFMRKKWTPEETRARLNNYILPGPALYGLPCRIGEDGDREIGSHLLADLLRDVGDSEMPRMKSVLPPKNERYTVTIRESPHKPERNSNVKLWTLFARKIGARLIQDTWREPLGLYERVALYAGADMNFGVPNGPLSLLWWTDYPVSMWCDPEIATVPFENQGIRMGEQVPWFRFNQRLVWRKPTMEALLESCAGTN